MAADQTAGHLGGHPIASLTGAVLAGGEGRRMGRVNKGLLTVGRAAVVDRVLARLDQTCAAVLVVANEADPYVARGRAVHPDEIPQHGSLGGLYTALLHAPTDYVFVCGCDMPFISTALIRHLAWAVQGHEAAVPRDGYGLQPLHAIYARSLAPRILPFLERGELRIERFIASIDARILPPEDIAPYALESDIFFNVNTPADLEQARAQSAARDDG